MTNDISGPESTTVRTVPEEVAPSSMQNSNSNYGLSAMLENVGAVAGAVSALSLLVSILYNWQYFRIVRADLFQLLTLADYFATGVQVVSAIAVGAVFSGVLGGLGAMIGSIIAYLILDFGSGVGKRLGAKLGDKIGGADASKERGGEFLGSIFRKVVRSLLLIGCGIYAYFYIYPVLLGLYEYIVERASWYEIASVIVGVISVALFLARDYYLSDVPGTLKVVAIFYVALMGAANCRAIQNARTDLERTQPTFKINYEGSVQEAVLMRSLEHVILIRLIETDAVAFIEWQNFKKGWFDRVR